MRSLILLENWKRVWNMKATMREIVIGVLSIVTKGLVKGRE